MPENFHDAKASKDAFTIYSKTKKGFIALIKDYNETEKYPVEREFLKGRLPTNNGLLTYSPPKHLL